MATVDATAGSARARVWVGGGGGEEREVSKGKGTSDPVTAVALPFVKTLLCLFGSVRTA